MYEALTKFDPQYQISNLVDHTSGTVSGQVVVTTLGKIIQLAAGGRGPSLLDLSALRCVVIDEADFFFSDPKNKADLLKLHSLLEGKKLKF